MKYFRELLRVENVLDANRRIYSVENITLISSFLGHVSFLLLFFLLRVWEMVIFNGFSIVFLFSAIVLNRKGKHFLGFIIGVLEVIAHAIAAVYFVGWETGFQYYFLVLVPFIFYWPPWKIMPKVFVSIILYLIYSSVFILSRNFLPVYVLEAWKSNSITLFIIFTTFTVYGLMARYYQVSVEDYENELQKANSLLNDLASTDSLTNLKNRRKMNQELCEEENRIKLDGKLFSLVMGDIDNFKMINDVYGHDFGDLVLVTISNIFKMSLRAEDVIARWGGEEFLILLPATNCIEAGEVIERLRFEIAKTPIIVDQKEIHITMTFGIAEYCEGNQMSKLINLADKAMYEGKMSGKNKVVIQSPINRDLSNSLN